MATTFLNMQDEVLGFLGESTSDTRTRVKRFLNRAASDFHYRYPWHWRRAVGFVSTVAPYTTGTVTLTNGSTTVTGSGATFTTAMVGRKIALTYGSPWYTISAFVSTTEVTLDRAYVEDTTSGATYVIYQDLYALSSAADSLLAQEVVCHKAGGEVLGRLTRTEVENAWAFPSGAGVPSYFHLHGVNSSGYLQIRVGREVPSTAFSIRYGYLSAYTEMSADGDLCVVPERFRHIIIHGALREAYKLYNDDSLASQHGAAFDQQIALAWMRQQSEVPAVFEMRAFDEGPQAVFHRAIVDVHT